MKPAADRVRQHMRRRRSIRRDQPSRGVIGLNPDGLPEVFAGMVVSSSVMHPHSNLCRDRPRDSHLERHQFRLQIQNLEEPGDQSAYAQHLSTVALNSGQHHRAR
jgi:hypothetical protein